MATLSLFEVIYEFPIEFTIYQPFTNAIYAVYGFYQRWRMSKSLGIPFDGMMAKRHVLENAPENLSEVVASVRDQVDKRVLKWMQKIQWPVMAVASAYYWWYYHKGLLSVIAAIGSAIKLCCRMSMALHWVPQVIINHKCRVGGFTPMSMHVVDMLFVLMEAYGESYDMSYMLLRVTSALVHLVLIAQANMYNNKVNKQE